MSLVKEEARKLIEKLPENATWDDVLYEFAMRKKLSEAIEDASAAILPPHLTVSDR